MSPVSDPRVSVVIPAHNAAATIRRALGSVLRQTYSHFEVCVVDDGSSDDTAARAEGVDPRVRVLRQPNQGVSAARNAGIATTTGPLMAFLDADDEWLPEKIERQVALLGRRPEVALVHTRALRIDAHGREAGLAPRRWLPDTYPALYRANHIVTSTVMARRRALEEAGGFDPALRITQDYDLWLRIAARAEVAGIDTPLARYHSHPSGLSADVRRRYEEHLPILERAPLRPDLGVDEVARERAKAHYQYRLGRLAVRERRWYDARRLFADVLRRPWRYRRLRRGSADHEVRYGRALRWYLVSRALAAGGGGGAREGGRRRAYDSRIYRKRKYHILSYLAPTWCLRRKSRRGYQALVATRLARGRFLDVGCGPGISTILYGRLGPALSVGLDLSGAFLRFARREGRRHRSKARFIQGDVTRLPFAGASFETIYLGQILEHLEEADLGAAMAEAERVLSPGGRLIISVPEGDKVPSEGHVREFDAQGLRALLAERGCIEVAFHPFDDRRLVCSGTKPTAKGTAAKPRVGPVAAA
jgi:glycosyltransferase involved in cell wall biosynthesis